nr:MAG TPA: hypothetical protein [Caudoviricetes sp.]
MPVLTVIQKDPKHGVWTKKIIFPWIRVIL